MKHYLKFEEAIPASLDEVWNFFSDAKNLLVLTPKDMNMRVITELENTKLFEGMRIAYYVSPLFKIPVFWETEIIKVEEQHQFIDIQLKGPFKSWKHTHTFKKIGDEVKMIDEIEYELPFGFIGDLFHKPIVLRNLKSLFEYRKGIYLNLFKKC